MRKNRIFPFFHMISGPTEGVPHIYAHTPRPGARHCRAIPKLADFCAESRGCAYPQWHICRSSHPRRPSRVNTDQAVPSAMWGHAVAREVQGSARRDAVPLGLLIAPWAVPATWSPGTVEVLREDDQSSPEMRHSGTLIPVSPPEPHPWTRVPCDHEVVPVTSGIGPGRAHRAPSLCARVRRRLQRSDASGKSLGRCLLQSWLP